MVGTTAAFSVLTTGKPNSGRYPRLLHPVFLAGGTTNPNECVTIDPCGHRQMNLIDIYTPSEEGDKDSPTVGPTRLSSGGLKQPVPRGWN